MMHKPFWQPAMWATFAYLHLNEDVKEKNNASSKIVRYHMHKNFENMGRDLQPWYFIVKISLL